VRGNALGEVNGVGNVPEGLSLLREEERGAGVRSVQEPEVRQSGYRHRVAGRVHDGKLADVQPGDVFFTVKDPSLVYLRSPDNTSHFTGRWFIEIQDDVWRQADYVGQPEDAVVVIHNTLNFPKPGGGGT
jgi:hypothetical protein